MARLILVGICLLTLSVSPEGSQRGEAEPRSTIGPPKHGSREVVLHLPVTVLRLRDALNALARSRRAVMSIEMVMPTLPRRDPAGPRSNELELRIAADQPLEDALQRMLREPLLDTPNASYVWMRDQSVYRVMPRSFADNPHVALSQPIRVLDAKYSSALLGLRAVVGMLSPSYRARGLVPDPQSPQAASVLAKPIGVLVVDGSLRQVLDEIVRQLGGGSWTAQYTDGNGLPSGLAIRVDTFQNAHVSVRVPF